MKPTGTDLFFVRESTHVQGSFLLLWQISASTRIVSVTPRKDVFHRANSNQFEDIS